MGFDDGSRQQIAHWLKLLYRDRAEDVLSRLEQRVAPYLDHPAPPPASLWNEQDAILITYGDQVCDPGEATPLESQRQFLLDHDLQHALNGVHFLPFCPYTSDDGFSVSDYRQIDPELGDWDDVEAYRDDFRLMFDLVLNHCSQQHDWFQRYLRREPTYADFFIAADPTDDRLSLVTRPRSLPLLTPFSTADGLRHVWTTFSDDQVDLNYAEPQVLIEMLDVLLFYAARGGEIIRLDAIAYLWKELGTDCIHLPQTHAVVKLMRSFLEAAAPGTILLTETNVPHRENVSYFGDGDEAQMVYQFSLAPLLLDAFLSADAGPLVDWLAALEPPPPGATYFNFTASHDGIGVRPLEGLVSPERFERLLQRVQERGGKISTRRKPDGEDVPYEMNITYLSAFDEPEGLPADEHAQRFLAGQAVMLALQGIPGIYFHSLVGTPNDIAGLQATGRARSINRRKFHRAELEEILRTGGVSAQVFTGYRRLLALRRQQPAFHPDAPQDVIPQTDPAVIAFRRTSPTDGQQILCLANVARREATAELPDGGEWIDLKTGHPIGHNGRLTLPSWEYLWLQRASSA